MRDRVKSRPCTACKVMILWAHTSNQTPIPLDPEPVSGPEGLYFLTQNGAAVHVDTFSRKEEREGRKFYRPHRLSCTQGAMWPPGGRAPAPVAEGSES
jgi:hypothetical protein